MLSKIWYILISGYVKVENYATLMRFKLITSNFSQSYPTVSIQIIVYLRSKGISMSLESVCATQIEMWFARIVAEIRITDRRPYSSTYLDSVLNYRTCRQERQCSNQSQLDKCYAAFALPDKPLVPLELTTTLTFFSISGNVALL